jgi:hypothetical protein
MANPPLHPDTGDDSADRGSVTATPRWVPVLAIVIVIALVLLVVVLHLTGVLGPGAH